MVSLSHVCSAWGVCWEFDHELGYGCGWLGWSGATESFVAALRQPDLAECFFSYSPTLVVGIPSCRVASGLVLVWFWIKE